MSHVAHEIVLSPSGRSFMVEADETILEAALRNGHAISYQCTNGTCGDCRARIIEGAIADHRPYDYVFKGEERQQPMMLMCRAMPASDMVIEVREATSVDDIPQQEILTTVSHLTPLQDGAVELRLRTPRSRPLRFMAGQQATLHIEGCAPVTKPIASCPCNGRELLFHFFKNDEAFFERLASQKSIRVVGPAGNFVLRQPTGKKLVFVAFEQGFAPVRSLIEYAMSLEISTPIELLWLARNRDGHYMENLCRSWKDAITNFDYQLFETGTNADFETVLKHGLAAVTGIDVYVAAPEAVVDVVAAIAGDRVANLISFVQSA